MGSFRLPIPQMAVHNRFLAGERNRLGPPGACVSEGRNELTPLSVAWWREPSPRPRLLRARPDPQGTTPKNATLSPVVVERPPSLPILPSAFLRSSGSEVRVSYQTGSGEVVLSQELEEARIVPNSIE